MTPQSEPANKQTLRERLSSHQVVPGASAAASAVGAGIGEPSAADRSFPLSLLGVGAGTGLAIGTYNWSGSTALHKAGVLVGHAALAALPIYKGIETSAQTGSIAQGISEVAATYASPEYAVGRPYLAAMLGGGLAKLVDTYRTGQD